MDNVACPLMLPLEVESAEGELESEGAKDPVTVEVWQGVEVVAVVAVGQGVAEWEREGE